MMNIYTCFNDCYSTNLLILYYRLTGMILLYLTSNILNCYFGFKLYKLNTYLIKFKKGLQLNYLDFQLLYLFYDIYYSQLWINLFYYEEKEIKTY